MSNVQSLSVAHNATVSASESVLQGVLSNLSSTAAQIKAAHTLHYGNCVKSALVNGIQPGQYISALYENHAPGFA